MRTSVRELHELIAKHFGKCPIRESSDGTLVYVLRQEERYTAQPVEFVGSLHDPGTFSKVCAEFRNRVVVLSGKDVAGKPYKWRNGDLLMVPRALSCR